MPFFLKTLVKTIFQLLLFTIVNQELVAMEVINNSQKKRDLDFSFSAFSPVQFCSWKEAEDTVTTEKKDQEIRKAEEKFILPILYNERSIDFQVNSEITYRSHRHFVKNESKKIFFQAWQLENELQKLTRQTDSLRKSYSGATNEQKEAMAANILNMEKRTIELNQEIPALYQNARNEENLYWKSVSEKEISSFQAKIKQYNDSVEQVKSKIHEQTLAKSISVSDTLYLEKEQTKTTESKPEASTEIAYKIQISAHKGKIPDTANKLIKKLSAIRKVENYMDDKGVKVYTTGNVRNYNEALTLQSQVKQEGVKNPIIAAYLKGKRIPVAEARKLNNEL